MVSGLPHGTNCYVSAHFVVLIILLMSILHVVVGVALLANAPERLPVKRKRPHDEVRCIDDDILVYS